MALASPSIGRFWGYLIFACIASRLPRTDYPWLGAIARHLRYLAARLVLQECGREVNIEHGVRLGRRVAIKIGDRSGLGINLSIGRPLVVGRDVMMGRNIRLVIRNHCFSRTDIPMRLQGFTSPTCLRICDDVWIGDQVIILPRVERIGKGAILGAGAVITKNVPDYAIMGGNPARVLRMRALTHDPTAEGKLTLSSGKYE